MDYHAREIFQALLGAYIEHWGASEAEVTRSIGDLLGALKLCVSAAHWQVGGTAAQHRTHLPN